MSLGEPCRRGWCDIGGHGGGKSSSDSATKRKTTDAVGSRGVLRALAACSVIVPASGKRNIDRSDDRAQRRPGDDGPSLVDTETGRPLRLDHSHIGVDSPTDQPA